MRFRLTVQVAKLRRTSHPRPSPLLFCSPLVDSTYPLKEKVKTLVGAQGDEHHCSGVGVMSKFKCSAVPVQELSKHSVRLSVDDISFQFKTSHVTDGRTDGRTATPACPPRLAYLIYPLSDGSVFVHLFRRFQLISQCPFSPLLLGFGMRIATQHASQSDCFIMMADCGAMI